MHTHAPAALPPTHSLRPLAAYSGSKVLPQNDTERVREVTIIAALAHALSAATGRLFQFKDAGVELVVGALLGNQVVVGAPFDDAAVV